MSEQNRQEIRDLDVSAEEGEDAKGGAKPLPRQRDTKPKEPVTSHPVPTPVGTEPAQVPPH